jgi:uracil-DNA glycosylase family 4
MSDMRDYYLKNLGVGEIWQLRQTVLPASPTMPDVAASSATLDGEQLTPWRKMQSELQQCQVCSLCARFGKGALGIGDATASILVIADWSVSDQLAQLEPVLQQSEKLMLNMLAALLADGAQASTKLSVYRTSLLKAQLSEPSQMTFDEAASDAARLCMNFLHQQIKLVQPRVLLVFGEHLGRILLGVDAENQIKMRQEQHAYQGIPVIVTHDAHFVLTHPESKSEVWQDLCRVKRL